MTAKQASTQRGGGYHEIVTSLALMILLSLILFLPAPGQAADVSTHSFRVGAIPPPIFNWDAFGNSPLPLRLANDSGIRTQEDTSQDDSEPAIVLTQDEYRRLRQGASLSPEEYRQFRKLISRETATAAQVAAVNGAVKGTNLFVIGLAWMAFLWILRRMFDRWFDADIHDNTWASTVVVMVLLIVTGWVLVSVT